MKSPIDTFTIFPLRSPIISFPDLVVVRHVIVYGYRITNLSYLCLKHGKNSPFMFIKGCKTKMWARTEFMEFPRSYCVINLVPFKPIHYIRPPTL